MLDVKHVILSLYSFIIDVINDIEYYVVLLLTLFSFFKLRTNCYTIMKCNFKCNAIMIFS